jgi:serpin B
MKLTLTRRSLLLLAALSAMPAMPHALHAKDEKPKAVVDALPVTKANNEFCYDLYDRLSKKDGNLFFSPHSIHSALGMALAGARNNTAREMAAVMRLTGDAAAINAAYLASLAALEPKNTFDGKPAYELAVANALYGQKGYPFNPEYRTLLTSHYKAALYDADFARATEEARKQINGWVEEKTKEKIKDLIKPGVLDPSTRAVLVNAIYFKAAWAEQFSKNATKTAPFTLEGSKTVDCSLMRRVDHYRYGSFDLAHAAELPYASGALNMVVILPKQGKTLADVENNLARDAQQYLGGLAHQKLDLQLPKFKFTAEFELGKTLVGMGMREAFQMGKADFTGIVSHEPFAIGEVIHKAFVDVHEEGTEAAAATAVVMRAGSAPRPEEPVLFKADHPFLFLIRHRDTGAILFMGRVIQP